MQKSHQDNGGGKSSFVPSALGQDNFYWCIEFQRNHNYYLFGYTNQGKTLA